MKPVRFLYLLVLVVAGMIIHPGCSPTSSTVRYKSESEEKKDKGSVVKFTSEDSLLNEQFTSDNTFEYDDEVYDEEDLAEIPDDEGSIDISEILKKYSNNKNGADLDSDHTNAKEKVLMEIIRYLNTPYKYGGNSKSGIDCSAFTQTVYLNTLSLQLLRSAREQFTQGLEISSRDALEFGDLVFFNTRRRVRPGHVGIYIGDNLFAHASTKHGVIISSLDHQYYSKRYMGARRLDLADIF